LDAVTRLRRSVVKAKRVWLGVTAASMLAAQAVVLAGPASASSMCTFDPGTATVTISVSGGGGVFVRRDDDAIATDHEDCPGATITNTDTIVVQVTDLSAAGVTILLDEPLAPGKTDEGDGSSEIEIAVHLTNTSSQVLVAGSTGNDSIAAGEDHTSSEQLVNLNADEAIPDVDVTVDQADLGYGRLALDGFEGDDRLSLAPASWNDGGLRNGIATGGEGDDTIVCGLGENALLGAEGTDTIECSSSQELSFALEWGVGTQGSCPCGSDTLSSFERGVGGDENDTMYGTAGNDELHGGGGNDVLIGTPGWDLLDGGSEDTATGGDEIAFPSATGIRVDLGAGVARGEGHDSLVDIEMVSGSQGDDRLTGTDGDDILAGEAGNDVFVATAGDDTYLGDRLHFPPSGTPGGEMITFDRLLEGVTVDLRRETYTTGSSTGHVADIDRVVGTALDDILRGNGRSNTLKGRTGDDVLRGRGGGDTLYGGDGNDLLDGGTGTDLCHGGAGINELLDC
jgi:Ca2+-binding RTX toxin-like protein